MQWHFVRERTAAGGHLGRYDRQQRVPQGVALDRDWQRLRVLLVGCGGVGTVLAQSLVRSGVGGLTVVDGDRIRETDLHRQLLYRDEDAMRGRSKAEAARQDLCTIGGRTVVDALPQMLTPKNAEALFYSHDVVLDATDNIQARSLIDLTAMRTGVGWIHSGAIADRWVAASFLQPGTPCYHCWVAEDPAPGSIGTCETDGVLQVSCLAAASLVIRLLTAQMRSTPEDAPRQTTRTIIRGSVDQGESCVELFADPGCTRCGNVSSRDVSSRSSTPELDPRVYLRKLCGIGSVETWLNIDFDEIETRLGQLQDSGQLHRGATAIRREDRGGALICYRDGRALVTGDHANDLDEARGLLERWLGTDALCRLS